MRLFKKTVDVPEPNYAYNVGRQVGVLCLGDNVDLPAYITNLTNRLPHRCTEAEALEMLRGAKDLWYEIERNRIEALEGQERVRVLATEVFK